MLTALMESPFKTTMAGARARVPTVQDGAALGCALDWHVIHEIFHITTLHLLAMPTLELHSNLFWTQSHTVLTTWMTAPVPTYQNLGARFLATEI